MSDPRARADEIIGRYREALDRGEHVEPESIVRLHPEIADDLRIRFAALHVLDRAFTSARMEPESTAVATAGVDSRVGPYRLLAELGSGGMGTVYLARVEEDTANLKRGAEVALKIVHPHLPSRPGFLKRFRREALAGQRVRHENVVPTFEMDSVGVEGCDSLVLAMEYVEGRTLRVVLEDLGVVPEALVREIARQVADGLDAIHRAGIVHRDLKPENVLVSDDHDVRIMDLGVARLLEESQAITTDGQFAGSLLYAAPEQFHGSRVGPAADLYALGVLLYELASGENPFRRDTTMAIIRAHNEHRPAPLADLNPGTSPFLSEVVTCLLEKDTRKRVASAALLSEILTEGERGAWWAERERGTQRRERRHPRLPVHCETRLYGRDLPLDRLRRIWDRARRGIGQTVLLVGEPGIGKTRFADAFLEGLESEDVTVLYGQYAPVGGSGGLTEAIEGHFGTTDLEDALRPYMASTPALVGPFADAVRQSTLPSGQAPLPQDAARTIVSNLARGLARERPLVWIVDDLHFASAASRKIVLALARALEGHRILLLVGTTPHLDRDDLNHFTMLDNAERIDLGRLSPREVVELLRDAFRSEALAEKLGVKVAFKSDGVPFFVFEMVRSLEDEAFIQEQEDGSFTLSRVVDGITVPSVVRDLVEARLRELARGEHDILDVGAVQGFEFDADLVSRVLGRKRVAVLQDLAEIERRSGLVEASGRVHQFDHHQIQEVVYADLNPALRAEYHRLIAEGRLARDGAENVSGSMATFLARHHLHGTEPRAAAPWILSGLDHLLAVHDHENAIALARRALEVPGLLPPETQIDLLGRIAGSHEVLARWDEEQAALDEAVLLATQSEDDSMRAALTTRLGGLHARRLQWAEARTAYDAARTIAVAAGDRAQEGRASCGLGDVLRAQGSYEQARVVFEEALALAEDTDDEEIAWAAKHGIGSVARGLGRLEEAERHLRTALDLSRTIDDRRKISQSVSALANVLKLEGQYEEAMDLHEQSLELSREAGHRLGEAYATGNIGNLLVRMGRFAEALRCQQRALSISREAGDRRGEAAGQANLGNVLLHLDRMEEARGHFEQYLLLSKEGTDRNGVGFALGRLGDVHLKLGDARAAYERFEQALTCACDLGDRHAEGTARGNIGRSLLHLGSLDEALGYLDASLAIAREVGDRQGELASLGDRGRLLLELGSTEAATTDLETCRALSRDIGDQRGEAYAEYSLGRVHLALEQPREARECFRVARSIAREIGGRRREALSALGLGAAMEALGRVRRARRHYEAARRLGAEIPVHAIQVLGAAHLAALGNVGMEEARRLHDRHRERLDASQRVRAAWLLWKATENASYLEEAWTGLGRLAEAAPESQREALIEAVPVNRRIREAWASHEGRARPVEPD